MGFFSTFFGLFGFGVGIAIGFLIGYFLFIYWQPLHVKDPVVRPISELDSKSLQSLLSEIPLWVKNPDYDRVDWLNRFIRELWPFLDKAICKVIRETTKPIIDQYSGSYKIDAVYFECLTLGTLPPVLQGVKSYDTHEREMMAELAFQWAGNPNILVAIEAFGLKASVQLIDMQLYAVARFIFKPLVPSFPCFSKIFVSLMEKPVIDFGLKLVGGDIMAVPGLYGFIQDIIKEQVANMYLWPKSLEVVVLEENEKATEKPVGILHVKAINVKGLKKGDISGKSNPYMKLSLGKGALSTKKTSIKMNTLNPEWNESFTFLVHDTEIQKLEVYVYDWEKVSLHDKLGMQVIPLQMLTPEAPKIVTLDLLENMEPNGPSNQKLRGQITLELTYEPFKEDDTIVQEDNLVVENSNKGNPQGGGLLLVIIHEAEDLEGQHHTNPYARLLFKGDERKTKVIKKCHSPRWNADFHFLMDEPPANDILRVDVISKGKSLGLHPREFLGYVEVNLADAVRNKRINDKYQLIDSKNGKIHIELQWRPG